MKKWASSDQAFGILVFAILLIYNFKYWRIGDVRPVTSLISLSILFLAVFWPKVFGPPKFLWLKIGEILGFVITPIFLGVIFFTVLTATSLIMRMMKAPMLPMEVNRAIDSYWYPRLSINERNRFKNQF